MDLKNVQFDIFSNNEIHKKRLNAEFFDRLNIDFIYIVISIELLDTLLLELLNF